MTHHTHEPGAGSCRLCLRDLFVHGEYNAPYCGACLRMILRHPDGDPTAIRNGRSEMVPQERPVDEYWWRDRAYCLGAPDELFQRTLGPGAKIPAEIREAAALFCRDCPVIEQCRAEADAHEYEGLWAGSWRRLAGQGSHRPSIYMVRSLLGDDEPEQAA